MISDSKSSARKRTEYFLDSPRDTLRARFGIRSSDHGGASSVHGRFRPSLDSKDLGRAGSSDPGHAISTRGGSGSPLGSEDLDAAG